MCLKPVTIVNPSKFISLKFRDRYLLQVPCNNCADCQSRKAMEWQYRTYYEFQDVLQKGGYIYFDTLTYSDMFVPRIRDFGWSASPQYCFNHRDITTFMKRLRIDLDRKYKGAYCRYFLSSEYGADDRYTHRPHYHVLFFVKGIDLAAFSKLVADNWLYGRTDGIPYKSYYYVQSHNYIQTNNLANVLRAANYVTKYVQKSCKLQAELDKRLNAAMFELAEKLAPDEPSRWLESVNAKRTRMKLARSINQFHRQSLHYGETALSELDIDSIMKTGKVIMPHFKGVKREISLPTYYKRKLFEELVEVDGSKMWQSTELGIQYIKARQPYLLRDLKNRFDCVITQFGLKFNAYELADYVLSYRGRFRAVTPSYSIEKRLNSGIDFYNYSTLSDKEHLGIGVTKKFVGNNSIGYRCPSLPPHYKIYQFIDKYVHFDKRLESQLDVIQSYMQQLDDGKQKAYVLKQHLTNLYKSFSL